MVRHPIYRLRVRLKLFGLLERGFPYGLVFFLILTALSSVHLIPWGMRYLLSWTILGLGVYGIAALQLKRGWRPKSVLENLNSTLASDIQTLSERLFKKSGNRFSFSEEFYQELEKTTSQQLLSKEVQKVLSWKNFFFHNWRSILILLSLGFFSTLVVHQNGLSGIWFHPKEGEGVAPPQTYFDVSTITVAINPPAYSHLPSTQEEMRTNHLKVLKGSQVKLFVTPPSSIDELRLKLPEGIEVNGTLSNGKFVFETTIFHSGPFVFLNRQSVSKTRTIDFIEDRVPTIELNEPAKDVETDGKGFVSFDYLARDDFELTEVSLSLVDEKSTFKKIILLSRPKTGVVADRYRLSLQGLLLPKEVEELKAEMVAKDNDSISGPKEGKSRGVKIHLLSQKKLSEARSDQMNWIKDLLIDSLANLLEGNGESSPKDLKRIEEAWQGLNHKIPTDQRGKALSDELTSRLRNILDTDNKRGALEQTILFLDQELLREQITGLTQEFSAISNSLTNWSSQMQKKGEMTSEKLKQMVQEIREQIAKMMNELKRWNEQSGREFYNMEALEGKEFSSVQNELEKIEQLLREGKEKEAKKKMEELLSKMKEMMKDLNRNSKEKLSKRDLELEKRMRMIMDEISRLKKREKELLQKTQATQKKSDLPKFSKIQTDIRRETASLLLELKEFEKRVPMLKNEASQFIDKARIYMIQATQALDLPNQLNALAKERDAMAALENAEKALQKGAQKMNSMGMGMNLSMSQGEGGAGSEGGNPESILIPESDRNEEAMAWRKKVLEGMQGKPPKGHEKPTQKYFEELMK